MRILQLISLILFTYTSKAQSESCTTDDKKFEIFGKEAKRFLTVKSLNSGNNMLSGVESAQSTGVGNAQSPSLGNAQSPGVGAPPISRMVNPQYGSVVLEGKTGTEAQQWRWRTCGDNHFIVSVATGGLLKLSKKEGQAPKLVTEPIGSNWNYDEGTGQLKEVKFGKLSRSMRLGIRKLKN